MEPLILNESLLKIRKSSAPLMYSGGQYMAKYSNVSNTYLGILVTYFAARSYSQRDAYGASLGM